MGKTKTLGQIAFETYKRESYHGFFADGRGWKEISALDRGAWELAAEAAARVDRRTRRRNKK